MTTRPTPPPPPHTHTPHTPTPHPPHPHTTHTHTQPRISMTIISKVAWKCIWCCHWVQRCLSAPDSGGNCAVRLESMSHWKLRPPSWPSSPASQQVQGFCLLAFPFPSSVLSKFSLREWIFFCLILVVFFFRAISHGIICGIWYVQAKHWRHVACFHKHKIKPKHA